MAGVADLAMLLVSAVCVPMVYALCDEYAHRRHQQNRQ
jgi:hypothetical protein